MNQIESGFYKAFLNYACSERRIHRELFDCTIQSQPGPQDPRLNLTVSWEGGEESLSGYIRLLPQGRIGRYIADFIAHGEVDGGFRHLVVEIDGHDFHEKTKEQAAHDKKRDRFFLIEGYPVLRFTGSEILKTPEACIEDILTAYINRFMGL